MGNYNLPFFNGEIGREEVQQTVKVNNSLPSR